MVWESIPKLNSRATTAYVGDIHHRMLDNTENLHKHRIRPRKTEGGRFTMERKTEKNILNDE